MKTVQETIDAIYVHGVFKPLKAPAIPDGQRVRLVVETVIATPEDLLALAAQVYEGLSSEQVDAIEEIAIDRRNFFGKAAS